MVIQILQVPAAQQVVWGRRQGAETGGSWGPRVLPLSETFIEHLLYARGWTKYGMGGCPPMLRTVFLPWRTSQSSKP